MFPFLQHTKAHFRKKKKKSKILFGFWNQIKFFIILSYDAEASNELAGLISSSVSAGNTASFEEMS